MVAGIWSAHKHRTWGTVMGEHEDKMLTTPTYRVDISISKIEFTDLAHDYSFQAMERPKELLEDVEEWIPKAWEVSGGAKL